jgi:hypothetical protein
LPLPRLRRLRTDLPESALSSLELTSEKARLIKKSEPPTDLHYLNPQTSSHQPEYYSKYLYILYISFYILFYFERIELIIFFAGREKY